VGRSALIFGVVSLQVSLAVISGRSFSIFTLGNGQEKPRVYSSGTSSLLLSTARCSILSRPPCWSLSRFCFKLAVPAYHQATARSGVPPNIPHDHIETQRLPVASGSYRTDARVRFVKSFSTASRGKRDDPKHSRRRVESVTTPKCATYRVPSL
jgi:hypothetical protein